MLSGENVQNMTDEIDPTENLFYARKDVPFGSNEIGTNTKNIKSPISLIYSVTYILTEGLQQCVYNKFFALKYYLILRYRL